jgi:predicted membrane-bound spermidine synthase
VTPAPRQRPPFALFAAVTLSGAAGLTWEVLWQHHATLALGASAFGAAITLASLMAGLGIGAVAAQALLRRGRIRRPLRAYGLCEIVVGAGGLLVAPALGLVADFDTRWYASIPWLAPPAQCLGIALALLPPSAAMGATLPLLAAQAESAGTRIGWLYALNTLGAVFGVVTATFLVLPALGVRDTERLANGLDAAVGLWAILAGTREAGPGLRPQPRFRPPAGMLALSALSGASIFVLEVSWFRSIRAAYESTTESFAIVLAAFLGSLALGAALAVPLQRRAPRALHWVLTLAAAGVLCATPLVDQLDRFAPDPGGDLGSQLTRLGTVFAILVLPVTTQGLVFPWLLERYAPQALTGSLYAANTLGAMAGAVLAGFLLLPWIGATHTSWLAAAPYALAAAVLAQGALARRVLITALAGGVLVAIAASGGTARERVQGFAADQDFRQVLYVAEGPDSTVWVTIEARTAMRKLVIDGFAASGEGIGEHYMQWMGHLPALATPRLTRALVICFGTGQTANAVRQHAPGRLDVVDLSAGVFGAASLFPSNQRVLEDPRVHAIVMDGRAFLRRQPETAWDLVTLEPMPPNFAGTNALYSLEFYQLIHSRLSETGVVAQWVPFHLLAPAHTRAIVATFIAVFPQARLWLDPLGSTGILLGASHPFEISRSGVPLDLSPEQIERAFLLDAAGLARLASDAELVTDDNQLLAYGKDRFQRYHRGAQWGHRMLEANLAEVRAAAGQDGR